MSESAAEGGDVQAEEMLADAVTQPDPETPSAQPDMGKQEAQAKDWESEATKWRAMARKHEQTAKSNAEAARKYAEFEESQKTEQQRMADRLAAAEQRAAQAEIGRARLLAAAAHNVPASLLDRIGGSSEEEINEAAEAIASEISAAVEAEIAKRLAAAPPPPPTPAPSPAPTRPVESLTPGAMPAGDKPEDGNSFLRRMAGRT